jgi:hypothetical protein
LDENLEMTYEKYEGKGSGNRRFPD